MHQRMCRQHGDLSANVLNGDPAADWDAKGVTWQAFEYAKPALARGLSSRCVQQQQNMLSIGGWCPLKPLLCSVIMGESGPLHMVKDALGLDAKLVPLWRAMARYADAQIGAGEEAGRGEGLRSVAVRAQGGELSTAEADRILEMHFAAHFGSQ